MDRSNVGNMNDYYARQYSTDDLQRLAQVNSQQAMLGMIGPGSLGDPRFMDAQTLDDILAQNTEEIQRRRSSQQSFYGVPRLPQDNDPRRSSSMMDFGSGTSSDLDGFQFDPSPVHVNPTSHPIGGIAARRAESRRTQRRESGENLGLNTQLQDITPGFGNLTHSPIYHQGLNSTESMNMDVGRAYVPGNMTMDMDLVGTGLDDGPNGDVTPMNMFSQSNFVSSLTASPIHQQMPNVLRGPAQDPGGGRLMNGAEQDLMDKMPNMHMSDAIQTMHGIPISSPIPGSGEQPSIMQDIQDFNQPSDPQSAVSLQGPILQNFNSFSTAEPLPNAPPLSSNIPQYRNAYSSSGFDMLGVLMRVAARPKPQINIGAVDMSCAFVVCDITQHDLPIVYCSDIFERLTGYSKHEILGRNCRFLQAPDGKVVSGVKRKYVDDQAVLHLKNMINQRQEAQISLINYRKGGQPFMNLLTMIPITYESDEMKYYVGFQVDLVEQPTSITNKNPGNYCSLPI